MKTKLPPPLVLIFAGAIAWVIDWLLPDWRLPVEGMNTFAGMLLGAALALMSVAAGWIIRHHTTLNPMHPEKTTFLITSGPFRRSRNPIYLADALILAAWLVWLGNIVSVVLLPGFVIYLNYSQIRPEERALALKFGEDYRTYCRRVRRWI